MTIKASLLAFAYALLLSTGVISGHDHTLCEGILPPNDMKIPVGGVFSAQSNINEAQFNDVLDQIEDHYTPIIAEMGGTLDVRRLWTNNTVNASAQRSGSTYIINMYGGLARHPDVTMDAFMLVACHEIGHHIAGSPKILEWFGRGWASNEGQSDYFANLRCMKQLLADEDNAKWVEENSVDEFVIEKCSEAYNTQEEENLCARISMAGYSIVSMFKNVKDLPEELNFHTPSEQDVDNTDDCHPHPQCRLDTYFQSALCNKMTEQELSDSDPLFGTCNTQAGDTMGMRPSCWYEHGTEGTGRRDCRRRRRN